MMKSLTLRRQGRYNLRAIVIGNDRLQLIFELIDDREFLFDRRTLRVRVHRDANSDKVFVILINQLEFGLSRKRSPDGLTRTRKMSLRGDGFFVPLLRRFAAPKLVMQ